MLIPGPAFLNASSAVYGSIGSGGALSPLSGRYVVSLLTGTTTINSIAAGQQGDILTLVASGQAAGVCVVFTQAGNILLRDGQGLGIYAGESLTFVYDGSSWRELDRNLKTVLSFKENTAAPSSSSTTFAGGNQFITFDTITFDGVTRMRIEIEGPGFFNSVTTANGVVSLADGGAAGTDLGFIQATTNTQATANKGAREFVPPAGAKTYSLVLWVTSASTVQINSGAGGAGTRVPVIGKVSRAL